MNYRLMNYSLSTAYKLGLDLVDLTLLRWFDDYISLESTEPESIDDEKYYCFPHSKIHYYIPIISLKKSTICKRLAKLVEIEVLKRYTIRKKGTKVLYTFGKNYKMLIDKENPNTDNNQNSSKQTEPKATNKNSNKHPHLNSTNNDCSCKQTHLNSTNTDCNCKQTHSNSTNNDCSRKQMHLNSTDNNCSREHSHLNSTNSDCSHKQTHLNSTDNDSNIKHSHLNLTNINSSYEHSHLNPINENRNGGHSHLNSTNIDSNCEHSHLNSTNKNNFCPNLNLSKASILNNLSETSAEKAKCSISEAKAKIMFDNPSGNNSYNYYFPDGYNQTHNKNCLCPNNHLEGKTPLVSCGPLPQDYLTNASMQLLLQAVSQVFTQAILKLASQLSQVDTSSQQECHTDKSQANSEMLFSQDLASDASSLSQLLEKLLTLKSPGFAVKNKAEWDGVFFELLSKYKISTNALVDVIYWCFMKSTYWSERIFEAGDIRDNWDYIIADIKSSEVDFQVQFTR